MVHGKNEIIKAYGVLSEKLLVVVITLNSCSFLRSTFISLSESTDFTFNPMTMPRLFAYKRQSFS